MARPTAHRLLTSLAREGLVDRDNGTGAWHLGPELYLLGATASPRYDVRDPAREVVHDLAASTGESAFFSARRGDETVCLLREDGKLSRCARTSCTKASDFPSGSRPQGSRSWRTSPSASRRRTWPGPISRRRGARFTARTSIRDRIAETRRVGYATNPGLIVEGSWGMAAAVFDGAGAPAWALSLTGVESRFREERRPELGRLLLDQAHRLTRSLRSSGT